MTERQIACDRLVIATGPWIPLTFTTLFPESGLEIPIHAEKGSYSLLFELMADDITRDDSRSTSVSVSTGGPSTQLMHRSDGRFHSAVALPAKIAFPDCAAELDALAQRDELVQLEARIRTMLAVPVEIRQRQICFNPATKSTIPIMARVPSVVLHQEAAHNAGDSGVYIVGGHGFWGVTAALGSGKLTAQLVLGLPLDISLDKYGLG